MTTSHHTEQDTNNQMDDIHVIQSLSRYNNKVKSLQKALGLPLWHKSETIHMEPRWVSYDLQVQALEKKLGLCSYENPQLRFHKPGSLQADVTSGKTYLPGKRHMTGTELHREVVKHCEPSAVQSMMESYSEDPLTKASGAPPKQEMVDKVLIRRSMAHAERQQHYEAAIRKLEAAKEELKKELKNLEAQNEFFGNGGMSQAAALLTLKVSSELRKENQNSNPVGTDLLKGLDMDESLLDEVVEEVMNANLSLQPKKMTPDTAEQLQKIMLEISIDRAVLLTEEEMILEVTFEMAVEIAKDVLRRTVLRSEFESHFDSAEVQEYLKNSDPLHF